MDKRISLKAWVNKEKKKVIFAESNEEFIDILFSFLTMPMGTIIRLIRNQPPPIAIGCMNNLYASVENFDVRLLRTEACRDMLLYPRNAAADKCKKLKLNIDDTGPLRYFIADNKNCPHLSHYKNAICECGERMDYEKFLCENESAKDQDRRVFVKELNQFMIIDDLVVMSPSTEESLSLLSAFGFSDGSPTGECDLDTGLQEVLTLLKTLLVTKTPLTETFLKLTPAHELDQGRDYGRTLDEPATNANGMIPVKLIVSKSKKIVLYAEANEDFVDLLFSFLTVPLGCIGKEMHNTSSRGCLNHVYNSVLKLHNEQFLISNEHKEMLVSPKLAPNFSYENHPLGIEEEKHPSYFFVFAGKKLISDKKLLPSPETGKILKLTVTDPKSSSKDDTKGGFVRGPKLFTVADNLTITRISPITGLALLKKWDVPYSDINVQRVNVGREEALRLLVASFVSESALTNAFLREPHPLCHCDS